ncbi:N-acetylglucosamine-6-phosphate deacetylase [Arthrobacter pigmenti]|uniref:N-acetylglucosamine-6-phosphate deacetylase n=1 Tax=Arthrobacter pigmenti TaxID=271432 RepID=A0A846RHS7_9MICC|nr:amidohydrolase family protein [Arthrobacter pigmenti]NJC22808.1 N-acetylglucosamine-6-phosphate deacetylase [Arthrobacter pigmenti]
MTEIAGVEEYVRARLVQDRTIVDDGVLAFANGRITYAGPAGEYRPASDASLVPDVSPESLILPGLVDVHCHGAFGSDFSAASVEECRAAVEFLHASGTTTLLASTMTAPLDEIEAAFAKLATLAETGVIAGIHAEGPFVSEARCGAQNPDYILDPNAVDVLRLLEAAQGRLKTMTYAPERPGADELIELLASHGVTPSLGHTDSDSATAASSLALAHQRMASAGLNGRPTVTHLFNGMPPIHHRSPGPALVCLQTAAAGNAVVELIADNHHLAPDTVRSVFGLVGADNVCLVTDSMAATGLPDGKYELGPSPVTVSDGVVTLDRTGSLAGGTATLLDIVRRTVRAGVELAGAVHSATSVPAGILGLSDELGALRKGLRADLVITTPELGLQSVMRHGQWIEPVT